MTNESPNFDFEELLRQAREKPGGVFGQLLAKIRARVEDEPPATDPKDDFERARRFWLELLRRRGILIIAFIMGASSRLRDRAGRLKSRVYDSVVMLAGPSVAVGNAFVAAVLVTLIAANVSGSTPSTPRPAFDAFERASTVAAPTERGHREFPIEADRMARYSEPLGVHLGSPNRSLQASGSIQRRDRRVYVDSTIRAWLSPFTGSISSAPTIWVDCDSSVRERACEILEPGVSSVPPPPSEPRR